MSQKIAQYLQQHVTGEVITSPDALDYFSTDASIFTLKPSVVVYPRSTNDVRKVARFAWQLAERKRAVPITARGRGTDLSGAAIGNGIVVVFPAHMNKVLEIDKGSVTVQPGITYAKLEQTLHTHGRFVPPYPASFEFSTIGGAIANNAGGEKSLKYGSMRNYVEGLNVVLANGELIQTTRLSKRDLNRKKGLTSFEGEIYRALDGLINDNWELIQSMEREISKNAAGYDLKDVKKKDGTFDLTPLMVGSQGTLGIVTQAVIKTAPHNPHTTLVAAHFEDIETVAEIIEELKKVKPSAIEMIDYNLLNFIDKHNPHHLSDVVEKPFPKIILIIELDDFGDRSQSKKVKRIRRILKNVATEYSITGDEHEKESIWKIRHSTATVISHAAGNARAVPVMEDGIVPAERFAEFLKQVYGLLQKEKVPSAVWGHAGDGNLHIQPFLDLSNVGDRQKALKLADAYCDLVVAYGGSTTGEHNDGRIRGPHLPRVYGEDVYKLLQKIKSTFDPHDILNPGVKINVSEENIKPLIRNNYSLGHFYDHMPRM